MVEGLAIIIFVAWCVFCVFICIGAWLTGGDND